MSEEEKEAIESIKQEISRVNKLNDLTGTYVPINNLEIILNLIQKQQKELEKKDWIMKLQNEYIHQNNYMDKDDCQFQNFNHISTCLLEQNGTCEQCIKQYFERKV